MESQSEGWSIERVRVHIDEHLPVANLLGLEIQALSPSSCDVVIINPPSLLRPGGSIAGSALFAAADIGNYAIILAARGDPSAVTIDTAIHFLRPAMTSPMLARTTPARLGRRLAIMETVIFDETEPERLLARATSTWAFS